MSNQEPIQERKTAPASGAAIAGVAAQAGCLTLAIIVVALLAGLWLDARFEVRGLFTIGLVLLSIPISLFVMLRVTLAAIKRLKLPPPKIFNNKGGE